MSLPESQETLLTLAMKRARTLRRTRRTPRTAAERRRLRERLAAVIRLPHYAIRETIACRTGEMSQRLFRIGPWTVPATVYAPPGTTSAELWIADAGRAAFGGRQPAATGSVYTADILGTGENAPNWQWLMLLECAGQRMLGIQTAQILACARLARRQSGVRRLHLVAEGLRASFAALMAAALEPGLFAKLTVPGSITSLEQLIELPCRYEQDLPLFCYGLLEVADIPELMSLLEHVTCALPARGVPDERQHG